MISKTEKEPTIEKKDNDESVNTQKTKEVSDLSSKKRLNAQAKKLMRNNLGIVSTVSDNDSKRSESHDEYSQNEDNANIID